MSIRASRLFDAVVGQSAVIALLSASVAEPVHAYLFVGPTGTGKRTAARAFAALLVDPTGDPDGRDARLALAGEHPDVREIQRVGASITVDQATEVVRLAAMAPTEGRRKVLILEEFHLLAPPAAAMLLKTIEEPSPSTVFLILADQVPPELVTIASRCARVDFRPLTEIDIVGALESSGVPTAAAREAAAAAGGNLGRARLLASDPQLAERRHAFARVASRLDGTGATVGRVVDELLGLIDAAADPLKDRHAVELAELEARVSQMGERGSGRKTVEDRHKRELRRHRVDELRSGLGVIAASYRDALTTGASTASRAERPTARRPEGHHGAAHAQAVVHVHDAIEALERNPNEALLLQALLLRLPSLTP
ncbi:MAG: ATP-binding protein [Acidimicrobiia bacterium]